MTLVTATQSSRSFAYINPAIAQLPQRGSKLQVIDEKGTIVVKQTESLESSAFTGGAGVNQSFTLPLAKLSAGDYLVRFVASIPGAEVRREVRFVRR